MLISLRCDDAGTELLTWALVKAALMGKSVVVVHVCNTLTFKFQHLVINLNGFILFLRFIVFSLAFN